MAFPTTSLVNNQVHKEGNRSFVYDSAIDVWDQVREADSSDTRSITTLGDVTEGSLNNPALVYPTGHVLQTVVGEVKSSIVATVTANTWTDISGFTASITPISTSSRVLVMVSMGRFDGNSDSVAMGVLRDSTQVGVGNLEGSRVRATANNSRGPDANHNFALHASFIDSPSSTSLLAYRIQWMSQGTVCYLNRSRNYSDAGHTYNSITHSSITLQEIA